MVIDGRISITLSIVRTKSIRKQDNFILVDYQKMAKRRIV